MLGGAFFAIAIVVMALPGRHREGIAHGIRSTVLSPVFALQEGTVEREARFNDPGRLRAERDSLAAFLVGQAGLAAENRQLRELLGLKGRLPPNFVPAQVVRFEGRGGEGFFQLTAGVENGVQAGAPIVAAEGLVGRVRTADSGRSFGIDWMHQEFRASAMTMDGTIYGIVEPRRGPGGEPMLALTGTPRHIQLRRGMMIVTSGHGGVFPPGIPIGTVAGVEGEETSWQRTYLVRPLVGPSEMTYVLVLGGPQAALGGESLAATWGIRPVKPAPDTAAASAFTGGGAAAPASRGAPAASTAPTTPAPAPEVAAPTPAGPPLLGSPVTPPRPDTTRAR